LLYTILHTQQLHGDDHPLDQKPIFTAKKTEIRETAKAAVKQTIDRLIASAEQQVTIITLTIGLLSGGH